jgi:hypothetical protein
VIEVFLNVLQQQAAACNSMVLNGVPCPPEKETNGSFNGKVLGKFSQLLCPGKASIGHASSAHKVLEAKVLLVVQEGMHNTAQVAFPHNSNYSLASVHCLTSLQRPRQVLHREPHQATQLQPISNK